MLGPGSDTVNAMSLDYPAGLLTLPVWHYVARPGGLSPASGQYRVICETPFAYTGTPYHMQRVTKPWSLLNAGWMKIDLPCTDQPGLTGDYGVPLDAEPAFRFEFQPVNDSAFGDARTVKLPTSLRVLVGGVVQPVFLNTLIDLGEWPNRVVIINQPPNPGPGGPVYVQDPSNPFRGYATTDGTF